MILIPHINYIKFNALYCNTSKMSNMKKISLLGVAVKRLRFLFGRKRFEKKERKKLVPSSSK